MESLDPSCTQLKAAYDECFNAWFRDGFLKGSSDHDVACGKLFNAYQHCLKKAIQSKKLNTSDLHEDLLGTAKEKRPP